MLFNSSQFALFFALFFAMYAMAERLPGRDDLRRWLILVGSFLFYGYYYPPYLILLATCVVVNWLTVRAIDRVAHKGRAALGLIIGNCIFNLGVLALYKYTGFALRTLNWTFLEVGFKGQFPLIDFALPLGVSFFTFEMMAYSIDVYRQGRVDDAARSLPRYAVFVTFFPKLIAGPIVRGWEILGQIDTPRRVTAEGVYWGLILFFWGLLKKVLISDRLAPYVGTVFADPAHVHWAGHWLAVYCFAFQIYCDFSAYSDMAIGLCRMLGYELPLNFKEPYLSPNITVFWRRWHITLSSWLRDYLYIPLGGSRGGEVKTYRNLILTMLLGGLWHGANWVYVIWGLMQGLYLAGHKLWVTYAQRGEAVQLATASDRHEDAGAQKKAGHDSTFDPWHKLSYWVGCFVTFHMVCLTWVFFRAGLNPSTVAMSPWRVSVTMLKTMFTLNTHGRPFFGRYVMPFLLLAMVLHVAERFVRHQRREACLRLWERVPAVVQGAAGAAVLAALLVLGGEQVQFIYFAF